MLSLLRSAKLWGTGILISIVGVLFAVLKIKSRKIQTLNDSIEMGKLKQKFRQESIIDMAEVARKSAEIEGQKRVEKDIDDAKRGDRRDFD